MILEDRIDIRFIKQKPDRDVWFFNYKANLDLGVTDWSEKSPFKNF